MILASAPLQGEDEEARKLLKEVREKIEAAQTIRVESSVKLLEGPLTLNPVITKTWVKGRDRWKVELRYPVAYEGGRTRILMICDGRKTMTVKAATKVPYRRKSPQEEVSDLRRTYVSGSSFIFMAPRAGQDDLGDQSPTHTTRSHRPPALSAAFA